VSSIDEKRVYAARSGRTDAFVACGAGLAWLSVSGGQIGEFALLNRTAARDVAVAAGRLVVAGEEVRLGPVERTPEGPPDVTLDATGFGPAAAVGVHDGAPVAAAPGADARVARYDGDWTTLATLPPVRGLSGPLAATADGVYRLDGERADGDARQILDGDARAVAAPLAATADGLYDLAGAPRRLLTGAFVAVAVSDGTAHAATGETLYGRGPEGWTARDAPDAPVALCHADGAPVVLGEQRVHVAEGGDWRSRTLGLPDVRAVAVA
jgi:hypothetical protein